MTNALKINTFTSLESIIAGGGNDTVNVGVAGRLTGTLNGGGGTDLVSYSAWTTEVRVTLGSSATNVGALTGFENATGGSGNDYLVGDGGDNVLRGGAGADILDGIAGADTLRGLDGQDILIGGGNADDLDGGSGDDIFI